MRNGPGLNGIGNKARDVRARRPYVLRILLSLDWLWTLARVVALIALDFGALLAAIFVALSVKQLILDGYDAQAILDQSTQYLDFVYLVTVLLFARNGLYASRELRPGLSRIVPSLTQVALVTLVFALIEGRTFSSYYIFYGGLFFAVFFVAFFRWIFDSLSDALQHAIGTPRRAVIVGTGTYIEEVGRALRANDNPRYETAGYVALDGEHESEMANLGTLDSLLGRLGGDHFDEVVLADPDFPQQQALDLADRCHRNGVRVRIAPSTMEILIHQEAEFVPGQTLPLFELRPPVFDGLDYVAKRSFDLVVALLLIAVQAPFLLAVALLVKLTSKGPVLYRSRRPGIGGEIFDCLKFRTMRHGAEREQVDLEHLNESSGALFKIRDDPRLTPIGGFLRRYSIDELPQLFNVVRGNMSLVGPRPLPERDYEQLEDWHRKRNLVLPGITGIWQISGRADLDFDELVRLDFLYLERWSVFLDLSILIKTVPAVFSRRGAF